MKVWLSSPSMYPDSMDYVMEAYRTNLKLTVGKKLFGIEKEVCEKFDCKYAVALSCGIAALHMAEKPEDKVMVV